MVSGWGETYDNSGVSDVLMKATVDTLSNQECRRKWGRFSFIASENICAGGIQEDQCSGDIGGPLVVQVEGNCPSAHAQIINRSCFKRTEMW